MIDVFCTLVNGGARAKVVDRLVARLEDNESTSRFNDYAFLKLKDGVAWQLEEYSHPLVINKYSEVSRMVMFKSEQPKYGFGAGSYTLTIEAKAGRKRVGVD